jgi:hypothetical protein
MRYAVECGIRFEMIFVTATMAADFACAGGPGRAKYILKLVDNHLWVSSVADGYPNPDLRISCR